MVEWQGARLWKLGLSSFLISGALAGLAGTIEFMGPNGRIASGFLPAHGFTAIEAAAPRAHEQGFLMFGSQRPPLLEPGPQCRHGRIRQR